jgi:large subunit ribosomal protein L37Ae
MTTKRFGSRYGRRVRNRLKIIEQLKSRPMKCPYCRNESVKRTGTGIFHCRKCNNKFTGRAYEVKEQKANIL